MAQLDGLPFTVAPATALDTEPDEVLAREGLPPATVIVAPTSTAPMRMPPHTWALLVQAIDFAASSAPDSPRCLELFAGSWLPEHPPPDLADGDLVVRIAPLNNDSAVAVDVEMLLAHHRRWDQVASWPRLGTAWPRIIAPAAATVMGLYTDLVEVTARHEAAAPFTSLLDAAAYNGLSKLLDAGLVSTRDTF